MKNSLQRKRWWCLISAHLWKTLFCGRGGDGYFSLIEGSPALKLVLPPRANSRNQEHTGIEKVGGGWGEGCFNFFTYKIKFQEQHCQVMTKKYNLFVRFFVFTILLNHVFGPPLVSPLNYYYFLAMVWERSVLHPPIHHRSTFNMQRNHSLCFWTQKI